MFHTKEELYYTVILSSIFFLLLIGIIIITALLYHNRKKLHQAEVSKFQHTLLQSQLEIQEQTFKTISQEIHDNIGQMLSLAKLNLNTIDFSRAQKTIDKVSDAKELVSKAIQDLRDLSKTLNTETITTIGLMRAIEMELQRLQKTETVQTHFDITGILVKLDAQKELILFRIVQEALHNIIKHARATVINVTAAYTSHQLLVTIMDDGCGFDKGIANHGSGLRNMQSRARLMNARMTITSRPGNGTQIAICLPINP